MSLLFIPASLRKNNTYAYSKELYVGRIEGVEVDNEWQFNAISRKEQVINQQPLSTINHAKAVLEYYLEKNS